MKTKTKLSRVNNLWASRKKADWESRGSKENVNPVKATTTAAKKAASTANLFNKAFGVHPSQNDITPPIPAHEQNLSGASDASGTEETAPNDVPCQPLGPAVKPALTIGSLADLLTHIHIAQRVRASLIEQKVLHDQQLHIATNTAKIAWRTADAQPYSRFRTAALEATHKQEAAQKRAENTSSCLQEASEIYDMFVSQLQAHFPPPKEHSNEAVSNSTPPQAMDTSEEPPACINVNMEIDEVEELATELEGLAIIENATDHGGILDLEDTDDPSADIDGNDEPMKSNNYSFPPERPAALKALENLFKILNPTHEDKKKKRFSEFYDLDLLTRRRLEDMRVLLGSYVDEKEVITWTAASLRAARIGRRGPAYARRLRKWSRQFILDGTVPSNPYGTWKESLLVSEDLVQELTIHLQSIGKNVRAMDIVDYLSHPDVQARWKLKKAPSLSTAQRWMHMLGYRWQKVPSGMYADGHEREDVVDYRQKVFLPEILQLISYLRKYDRNGEEILLDSFEWPNDIDDGPRPFDALTKIVLWFHDESTFYANDRRKTRWVHVSETAVPYAKGEGASLMVADFVSADYGYLRFGDQAARRIFRAGKNRDGYFTTEEIIEQIEAAMDILEKHYPNELHIFIYDNAPIHVARPAGARSAKNMPKNISSPDANFLVEINRTDANGKLVYGPDGKIVKDKIRMEGGWFYKPDGSVQEQSFYHDDDDEQYPGLFKGMAKILEERGYTGCAGPPGTTGRYAQCNDFKDGCKAANRPDCCCRRMLFNEPDFVNVKSRLEEVCHRRGFKLIILPKFHCELNFIEQVWGYAKRIYRRFPPSSKEGDLERNMLLALEAVPLKSMRRFQTRCLRFCDAYAKGLDGKQAAWASKKYKGHRVLPPSWKEDLLKADVARYDGSMGVSS